MRAELLKDSALAYALRAADAYARTLQPFKQQPSSRLCLCVHDLIRAPHASELR